MPLEQDGSPDSNSDDSESEKKKTFELKTMYVGLTVLVADPRKPSKPRPNQADIERLNKMITECADGNDQLSLVTSMLSIGMTWLKTASTEEITQLTVMEIFARTRRQSLDLIQ